MIRGGWGGGVGEIRKLELGARAAGADGWWAEKALKKHLEQLSDQEKEIYTVLTNSISKTYQ